MPPWSLQGERLERCKREAREMREGEMHRDPGGGKERGKRNETLKVGPTYHGRVGAEI